MCEESHKLQKGFGRDENEVDGRNVWEKEKISIKNVMNKKSRRKR